MEKFTGTLIVEQIRGRHGPFCVGLLQTSIGQFKVKDKELDQFEPGNYRGQFLVEEIFTKAVPWRGGTFTELLARIAEGGFLIDEEQQTGEDSLPTQAVQTEPDPVDEEAQQAVATPARKAAHTAPAARPPRGQAAQGSEPTEEEDLKLFGIELYELFVQRAARISLDPTVDRVQFRSQRERLKSVGYQFEATSQQWVMAAAAN
ncbi:hypothetical protein B9Z51_06965 [Limnohabitans sp. T6-5]|uniref:DUF3275 family protein n=1 Tax=Limnohabitans sp. T6-5 TaxID=1100724 RepID=UPI000D3D2551|nr:DUF3275 family protein [Limnohabitans sp. T6-5]PUE08685.1 hypothetical protein B9Z51_06965 [Limnohabitans sp. T6-5]